MMRVVLGFLLGLVAAILCSVSVVLGFGIENDTAAFVVGIPFGLTLPFVGVSLVTR